MDKEAEEGAAADDSPTPEPSDDGEAGSPEPERKRGLRTAWDLVKERSPSSKVAIPVAALVATVCFGVAQYKVAARQYDLAAEQYGLAQDQLKAVDRQYETAVRGQLVDRYFRAVAMLGSEQLELRRVAVEELLDVANAEAARDKEKGDGDQLLKDKKRVVHTLAVFASSHAAYPCESRPDRVGPDVQEAIDVVGQLQHVEHSGFAHYLSGFTAWDDQGGAQEYRDLPPEPVVGEPRRCWRGARLDHDFRATSFLGFDMPDAAFGVADLSNTMFSGANLEGLTVKGSELSFAKFDGAALMRARFLPADRGRAPASKEPSWSTADDREPSYTLEKADFTKARLCGAVVSGSVSGASFRGAKLYGANLSQAEGLASADLTGVEYDPATQWPPNFVTPPPSKPSDGRADCS